MKKSTSCRRFYILMFLMVVITYQYVDFHAANNALTFTKILFIKTWKNQFRQRYNTMPKQFGFHLFSHTHLLRFSLLACG